MDSNHRRRSRQIYSLLPLATRESFHKIAGSNFWSWWSESNQQPADYKSAALPIELHQHNIFGGLGRNRTTDTEIFSLLLYRLSYQAKKNGDSDGDRTHDL